jgi:transposase
MNLMQLSTISQYIALKYIYNTLNNTLTSKYIKSTIKGMRYTKKQFEAEYPDDDACLEAVFQNRFGDLKICPKCGVSDTKFYRVKKRQCYACMHCGYQLHPLAGTIFRKTTTPLKDWFYAIYLFSVAKNGVSAKELERHLGVTYKTAWRMAKQIRLLMAQDVEQLNGMVEVDETYIGGRTKGRQNRLDNKTAVMGAVEKLGSARAQATGWADATIARSFLNVHLSPEANLQTDDSRIYRSAKKYFKHEVVNHSEGVYVQKGVSTNTIEGVWSQMKRSIDGTYHVVSPKYLQSYVDEFIFRYNYRDVAVCPVLLERV